MNKPYPRMKCWACHRPMARAAALKDGYPLGPVCAAAAGLIPGRGAASARVTEAERGGTVVRDTLTAIR